MFELAASAGGRASQNATSRSDLRQVQQDALAEYVERKRSVKRAEAGQRGGSRPRSAYVQPENNQTSGYRYSLSTSFTCSLLIVSCLSHLVFSLLLLLGYPQLVLHLQPAVTSGLWSISKLVL